MATSIMMLMEANDRSIQVLVLIMSCTMMFKSLEVIEYWIQAYQNAKVSSIIRISVYIISSALKLLLVVLSGNLVHFTLIYALEAVLIGAALVIAYIKLKKDASRWKFSFGYAKNILSKSWYLILSGLMVTLYMRIDQVMLGSMLPTKTEVGVYSAAVRIAEMWYFVPLAIITSFNPVIMRKKKNNESSYLSSVQLLYTLVAWTGVGFGVFILFTSKSIITLLYGSEYLKAADLLSISIWAGTFAVLGSAQSSWLISEGLQRFSTIFIGLGALTNILLNLFLIPSFGGYGAAIATLVSQVLVVVIVPLCFSETRISSSMMLRAFMFKGLLKK
jgi:O-antigen/teichoic acid export membrane protein